MVTSMVNIDLLVDTTLFSCDAESTRQPFSLAHLYTSSAAVVYDLLSDTNMDNYAKVPAC